MIVQHTQPRHDATQNDDQRHDTGHTETLQLERVPLVEALQFVVLEAQLVPRTALGRFYGVIHGDVGSCFVRMIFRVNQRRDGL